jgi:D-alanyl-D-alanine carboxypeptidase/D-alanyl-D-alanine-endopeptidase (penicillin-binding protein 4)
MLVAVTRRVLIVALIALLAHPAAASATLGGRVASIVSASRFAGPGTGIVIYDETRDRLVYRRAPLAELKPASNMKLTTAAAALGRIGAGARLSTRVYATGSLVGGTLTGNLWLVGGGDPSLSTGTFAQRAWGGAAGQIGDLAAAVRAAGIRHVTGRVFGDETLFDKLRTGPLWKASYWRDCPPISALSVNKSLHAFDLPYSYPSPALRAAEVLRGALKARGVRVDHDPRVYRTPGTATLVAGEPSPPMYRLVLEMNRPSDNYFAEVLNKRIATAVGMAGTTHNGRRATRAYLMSLGINMTGSRLYDGSGLSTGDRLSARQILAVLRRASFQTYGGLFRKSLPVAGVSGTLSHRMRSGPAYANAQAKTGTLDDASALSGYVRSANGHQIVFSIVINRKSLDIDAARALQDRIVQTLAGSRPL